MSKEDFENRETPLEWVRLLSEQSDRLESVQMVWRRANLPYRPIVPEHLDIQWLTDEDWDKHEREDTHFMWELGDIEDPEERTAAIQALAQDLWSIAMRWTELRGAWCDFRLLGFDGGDELFCCGRRCRPPMDGHDEQELHVDVEGSPAQAQVHAAQLRFLEERLAVAQAERSEAFDRSNKLLHDNHARWAQLSDAMRDASDFQRQQVDAANEMRSGAVELRATAFRELQETIRVKNVVNAVTHGIDAMLGQLVPLADRAIDAFGGDRVVKAEVFPQFERAQQALRYLALTLTDTQLTMLFNGDAPAGAELRVQFDRAARLEVEIEALAHITPLVSMLRSTKLREIADPEQQLCVRYIIGRLAMFDIATSTNGEDPSQSS